MGTTGTLGSFGFLAVLVTLATAGAALAGTQLRQFLKAQERRDLELRDRKVQAARQHARAIYEMASMVSATLGYEKVLEAALNRSASCVACPFTIISCYSRSSHSLGGDKFLRMVTDSATRAFPVRICHDFMWSGVI